jgi:hypothetical protein
MPITAGSRRVSPERIPTVTIPDPVRQPGISGALEAVGEVATTLGRAEVQLQEIEQRKAEKREAAILKDKLLKDKTAATNAFVTYQGTLNEKENEIRARKQLAASGSALEFKTFSNESFNKINQTLTSPEAQELFFEDARLHNLNRHHQASVYEREETEKGMESSFTNATKVSVETGIRDFKNPNTHGISEDHIEENARSLQELKGWSKDETDLYIANNKSRMYEAIVRKWAIEDAEIARLSFETNMDKIDPERHDELDTLLKVNDTNQKAKVATDDIMLQYSDDEKAALEAANNIEDAEVSAKTKQDIRTRFADNARIKKQDSEIYRNDMFGKLHDMSRLPDAELTQMLDLANSAEDGKDRSDFSKYARALIDSRDKTKPIVTDNVKYNEILSNISAGVYPDLATLRGEARPVLSDADLKHAETFFSSGGLLGGLTEETIIKQYKLHSGGKDPFMKENAAEYQAMRQWVVDQVQALPPGRQKITPTELNKWSADALIPVELPDTGIFSPDKSTLSEALESGVEFEVIVPDERKEPISRALRELGVTVNELNIRDYYIDVEREVGQ